MYAECVNTLHYVIIYTRLKFSKRFSPDFGLSIGIILNERQFE